MNSTSETVSHLAVVLCALALLATVFVPNIALGQEGNDKLIEDAAELFGYTDLTDDQWQQLELASEQVLEGLRSSRYTINLSQAVSIAYIGLVLQNRLAPATDYRDDRDYRDSDRRADNGRDDRDDDRRAVCPALNESVQAFVEFGNNSRNFSLWVKLSLRDDVEDLLDTIRDESRACDCRAVGDAADDIQVDTSLTPEKYRDHGEKLQEALADCR